MSNSGVKQQCHGGSEEHPYQIAPVGGGLQGEKEGGREGGREGGLVGEQEGFRRSEAHPDEVAPAGSGLEGGRNGGRERGKTYLSCIDASNEETHAPEHDH